ncbi:protein eyes shut homolog [Tachysurus ichikawai]
MQGKAVCQLCSSSISLSFLSLHSSSLTSTALWESEVEECGGKEWGSGGQGRTAEEQKFGDRFLHLFLQDGYPGARLGCSGSDVLKVLSSKIIENNTVEPIIVR